MDLLAAIVGKPAMTISMRLSSVAIFSSSVTPPDLLQTRWRRSGGNPGNPGRAADLNIDVRVIIDALDGQYDRHTRVIAMHVVLNGSHGHAREAEPRNRWAMRQAQTASKHRRCPDLQNK